MVAEAADDAAAAPLARDVYEHAALYSLLKHDTDGFERHFALARCCYSDEGCVSRCRSGARPVLPPVRRGAPCGRWRGMHVPALCCVVGLEAVGGGGA